MLSKIVAKRYARALIRAVSGEGEARIAKIEQDLLAAAQTVTNEPVLTRFLDSPKETPARKKELLDKVFAGRFAPEVTNLLRLLVDKKRHEYLSAVADAFKAEADSVRGVAIARVRTAQSLSPQGEEALRERLHALTGREVQLQVTIDPEVVGGIYIRVGNRIIDYTLQKQLADLKLDIVAGRLGKGAERRKVRRTHSS